MKIRLLGNSVRLRLTRSEVETYGRSGRVEAFTDVGSARFTYVLASRPDISGPEAEFTGGMLTVYLPEPTRREWPASDRVGYSGTIKLPAGSTLSLLVEKDFACLDRTDEDQSDQYPNPKGDAC